MRIDDPMSPAELPTSIAASTRLRRAPIFDDEANVVAFVGVGEIARHFRGSRAARGLVADTIARTLATVSRAGNRAG